jgi:nucleoside-diphosphate-sugar epimerase|tara:strand:- start:1172 stop:2137 length:966 start_codon:yes stop_codon:yes gene_type:complete
MKILLTGSEGFVGVYLRKELERNDNVVYCIDRAEVKRTNYFCFDLSNEISSLAKLLKDESFDLLIHLAAAKGDYNLKYDDFYRDNVTASEKTISLVKVLDIKSIIAYSTVSVYGHDYKIKSEEADLVPNNPYGATKLESENIFIKWHNLDPIKNKLTILRPSVIYGENNFANMYNLLDQLNKKFPVSVDKGNYIKSMVAVENIVDITVFSINKLRGLQIYNCTDKPYPKLKEVIKYISEIKGFSKPKIVIPKWFAYLIGLLFECFSFLIKKDLGITRERIYKFTMPTDYRSEKLAGVGYIQKHSVKDRVQNMAKWYLSIKK